MWFSTSLARRPCERRRPWVLRVFRNVACCLSLRSILRRSSPVRRSSRVSPEVAANGIDAGDMLRIQMQKIEELTLYAIKQERQLKDQQDKIQKLEGENSELKNAVSEIKQLKEQFLMMKVSIWLRKMECFSCNAQQNQDKILMHYFQY